MGGQLELFPGETAEQKKNRILKTLKHFEEPSNDNQILLNLQYDFVATGDSTYIWQGWNLMLDTTKRLIKWEMKKKGLVFSREIINEKSEHAVFLKVKEVLNGYYVKTSFVASLYDKVREVLYKQSKGESFYAWLVENKINFEYEDLSVYKKIYEQEKKQCR